MWAVGLVVGALLGAAAGNFASATFGAAVGFVIGIAVGRDRKSRNARIAGLETVVAQLADDVATLREQWQDGVVAAPRDVAAQATAMAATGVAASSAVPEVAPKRATSP